ncbi:hypothetical protein F3Y22_tig00110020pilonHSYRG00139 [Hibiscus syriacus]|uniref:HIG1 domain-containing protein n=1 Tax=Hibiscus syriacus TaxID=106335 RepID=A0A6A3BPU0_HIBSY|nr:hypothetical protein F3Y22_tig00110020pilonHSYRG00139 [Hibiscus syriacus]
MEAFQSWVSEHKLTAIAAVWASAIGASLAYNSRGGSSLKPSLRLIMQGSHHSLSENHGQIALMHSQALTLAVLSAAAYHYYEKNASSQDKLTLGYKFNYSSMRFLVSLPTDHQAEWSWTKQVMSVTSYDACSASVGKVCKTDSP